MLSALFRVISLEVFVKVCLVIAGRLWSMQTLLVRHAVAQLLDITCPIVFEMTKIVPQCVVLRNRVVLHHLVKPLVTIELAKRRLIRQLLGNQVIIIHKSAMMLTMALRASAMGGNMLVSTPRTPS